MSLNALVDEYERESQRVRLGDDGELIYDNKRKNEDGYEKPKRGRLELDFDPQQAYSAIPIPSEANEKNLSALAFAMPLLMLLLGTLTAGFGVPVMLLITLIIYMSYKDRSEFVRQNVGEALKGQLIGTLGWIGLLVAMPVIGAILTVILTITIVGVLLVPFLWIAIVIGILASLAIPVWMIVFGLVGAWEALQGKTYTYPVPSFITKGRWRTFRAGNVRVNL